MRRWWHRLITGHEPEWAFYGRTRLCLVCDTGTPKKAVVWNAG